MDNLKGMQWNDHFLIKKWSGPVNFYYLRPKLSNLPPLLLFGDDHSGFDEMCDQNDSYAVSPTSDTFIQLLNSIGTIDRPVNYFIENWFHFKDPDDYKQDRKSLLSQIVNKAVQFQKESAFPLTKNESLSFNQTCSLCNKPILLRQYYTFIQTSYFHARCTQSVRWHSIDIRQPSLLHNTIEASFNLVYLSNLTNIDFFLLGGLLDMGEVFTHPYSKKIIYKKYLTYKGDKKDNKLNTLQFTKNLFNVLRKDPIYMENSRSILIKEIEHTRFINWEELYHKSVDFYLSFYKGIDDESIHRFRKWICDGAGRGGMFVFETIALCCTSPLVDLYTIARMLKGVKENNNLSVVYAGANHVTNIAYLLMMELNLYEMIDGVETDRNSDIVNRCLEVNGYYSI
jgi:hypothetical protein